MTAEASPKSKRQFISRLSQVFWGQAVAAGSAFAGLRISTELMEKSAFGHAMLALGVIVLLDSVSGMALNQTIIARCASHQDREHRRQLSLGLAWLLTRITITGCVAATIALAAAVMLHWINPIWLGAPALLAAYFSFEYAKHSLLALYVLDRSYSKHSTWVAIESMVTLIGIGLTLVAWRSDAIGYIIGYLSARMTSTLILLPLLSSGRHIGAFDLNAAKTDATNALAYGAPVALMGPIGWTSSYLDRYALGAMLNSASAGCYVAATGVVSRPYSLTTSVLTNFFRPLYYQPPGRIGSSIQKTVLINWCLTSFALGGLGALTFLLVGEHIAKILLANEYRQGAPLLMFLFAVSQTIAIMTHGADNAVLALGGSARLLRQQTILSFTTFSLIPLGIFIAGSPGALIGRALAEAIKFSVISRLALRMISDNDLNENSRPQAKRAS